MPSSVMKLSALAALLLAGATMVAVDYAEARVGGGRSFGSRGTRTYTAPPTTNTAPGVAKPMERSMTQPGAQTTAPAAPRAGTAAQPATRSMFGGIVGGLLLGGLMAAGFAAIFGAGALANVLGFLLQGALIAGLVYLAFAFFRSRQSQPQPAVAGTVARDTPQGGQPRPAGASFGGLGPSGPATPLAVKPEDFTAFERLLGEIQAAYGRGDITALGDHVMPEMLSYFAADLDANAKKGLRNELGAPKLLQGDMSEAWREAGSEYATVAMRFALSDAMVEVATGRVVEGSRTEPQEATEVWTFQRPVGGRPDQWELSAIQQA